MSRLNDYLVNDSDEFGEPTLQGVSEGNRDSVFARIFGAAERTVSLVRDLADPVETNARLASPPTVTAARNNPFNNPMFLLALIVGAAVVLIVALRGK